VLISVYSNLSGYRTAVRCGDDDDDKECAAAILVRGRLITVESCVHISETSATGAGRCPAVGRLPI